MTTGTTLRAVLVVVVLGGCLAGPSAGDVSETTTAFPLLRSFEDRLDADLEGILGIDGDCPYVTQSFDGRRFLLLFPVDETAWDAASETLTLYDVELADGDLVSFRGYGYEDRPEGVDYWTPDVVNPPAPECDDTNVWHVHGARIP